MKVNRSLRLVRILRDAREREAARSVARESAGEAEEKVRLRALETWQRDYLDRQREFMTADQRMTRNQLSMWRVFVSRLNTVIEQQREVVRDRGRKAREQERDWLATRTELAAVDHLDARADTEHSRAEERREQAETDQAGRRRR